METTFTMITPFLQIFLIKELNVSATDVNFWSGLIFSITFFISGLMGPVWGLLSDRKSRKLMVLRASIGLALSYALCGIVTTPLQLFFARFLQGFCAGLYPALLALVATTMPHNRIGFSMGLLQGGMTVGGIAGPFLGGVMAETFGMRSSFYLGGVSLMMVTLLVMFFVKEGEHPKVEKKADFLNIAVLKNYKIQIMLFCSMIVYLSLFSLQPILPLYLAELQNSMDNIMWVSGSVFSVCGISVMIASPLLGIMGQKYGFLRVFVCCALIVGVVTSFQVIPDTITGFTAWRFVGGFAVAGLIPMINSLLTEYSAPQDQGTIFGYNFLSSHVGMAGGPLLAGMLAYCISYSTIIVASGLILLPMAVFLILIRNRMQATNKQSD